jgi:uncharacterized membrane protein
MNPSSTWHSGAKLAVVSADGLRWRLRKNCSVTPRQVMRIYAFLSLISLSIAAFFWSIGAVLVLPFACLEIVVLGVAFWWYAKHAVDGETVSCNAASVVIDTSYAGEHRRYVFEKHTVRVHQGNKAGLVEVYSQGQKLEIGRFLRVDLRPILVSELRRALAHL